MMKGGKNLNPLITIKKRLNVGIKHFPGYKIN